MNQFFLIGLLILIALYSGKLFNKLKFPVVTGYILIGFIIGNVGIAATTISKPIEGISFYINTIALSILLFELGAEFNIDILRNKPKKVIIMAIAQSLIAFAIIFLTFGFLLKITLPIAALIAVIGMATAPDITVLTLRELGIRNEFTELIEDIVTIDDLLAEFAFFIIFPIARNYLIHAENPVNVLFFSFREIFISVILGIVLGFLLSIFSNEFKKRIPSFAGTIGFLLASIGLSIILECHVIIVLLVTGMVFATTARNRAAVINVTRQIDSILFILFLIVNGFALSFNLIRSILIPAGLLFILSRGIGKIFGGILGTLISRIDKKQAIPIGISILSQSTISIYFAAVARGVMPNYGDKIFAITMSGVIFFEIIGAPLLKLFVIKTKTNYR
jgi:Kef-type K+ transport system membrane component KefB